jgi:hypothetical protein
LVEPEVASFPSVYIATLPQGESYALTLVGASGSRSVEVQRSAFSAVFLSAEQGRHHLLAEGGYLALDATIGGETAAFSVGTFVTGALPATPAATGTVVQSPTGSPLESPPLPSVTGSDLPVQTPLSSRLPDQTGLATSTPTASISRTPTTTPVPKQVTVDKPLEVNSSEIEDSVQFVGTGTIQSAEPGVEIELKSVFIPSESNITVVDDMIIETELSLTGSAILAAGASKKIDIEDETTVVHLAASTSVASGGTGGESKTVQLPRLDIGAVGNYVKKPQELVIEVRREDFGSAEAYQRQDAVLVEGRTLNCKTWQGVASFPAAEIDNFETYCYPEVGGSGRRLAVSDDVPPLVQLRIRAKQVSTPSQSASPKDEGIDAGLMAGVVAGVVVVVAVVIGAIVMVRKKGSGGGSSESVSDSLSA